MRLFVALLLPEPVRAALAGLQADLPVGRLVPEENLHLTLAFLGEMPEARLAQVHEALGAVVAAPVTLRLAGLDTFGGAGPRSLHVVAAGPEELQGKIVRHLRAGGIVLERRRFRPHVTLARFGHRLAGHDARRLAGFLAHHGAIALPPVRVASFALMASQLLPDGARHEVLAAFPLAG